MLPSSPLGHVDAGLGDARDLYLDLLKRCLTRTLFIDDTQRAPDNKRIALRRVLRKTYVGVTSVMPFKDQFAKAVAPLLRVVQRRFPMGSAAMIEGREWPAEAETMIGMIRLDNLQNCIVDVIRNDVPGDLIETGAWRGGATIFMRAVLKAYGDSARTVWVADSFQGLPKPEPTRAPADAGDVHWTFQSLAIPLDVVKQNFARYRLLDAQVQFLVGWFRDVLPGAPIEKLAILRLDGDMYASTMDALEALYDKVSIGGYVIVDDYGAVPACEKAVADFRSQRNISEPIIPIDWAGVYWKKERA
jgi:O-methyltransferase